MLQFLPFMSTIESGFWSNLADLKLNVYKLDNSRKDIQGFYSNSDAERLPCRHALEYSAFTNNDKPPPLCFVSHGSLYNSNTIEDFKTFDHKNMLNNEAKLVWDAIVSREAVAKPHLLVRFLLLTHADLKKFIFHYWFAFPAFIHSPSFTFDPGCSGSLEAVKSKEYIESLQNSVDLYCEKNRRLPAFFLICNRYAEDINTNELKIYSLEQFEFLFEEGFKFVFGMSDPSTIPDYPGWPLRNFLTLISYHWASKLNGSVDVVCYRDRTRNGTRSIKHSLFFRLKLEPIVACPSNCTGWEKNKKKKLGPRSVNLADSMDPVKLAESSVSLNLKLMRWRLMPSLNLEKIATTKCLLLGSGTLGCNVARGLLAWGVHHLTLVDNGTVSFSNPVRQTLFEFSDCSASGGRSKAMAAAERLKSIFPSVDATGVELTVPMPGHPVHQAAKIRKDVEMLKRLIEDHDVIYLLMDTRESRWLPTLLTAVKRKFVINVALGFDSYLVMRHGIYGDQGEGSESNGSNLPPRLGCYFCNDVVAPGNSMNDRTLDQQCTVTRPGVSMIASALAVELMVSLLQHPLGAVAPPDDACDPAATTSSFGPVPHQIRGFLSQSNVFYPTTEAFSKCTACSKFVVDEYQNKGFDFLIDVFNSTHHFLEDLTGLTLLHQLTSNAEVDVLEFSDSESI